MAEETEPKTDATPAAPPAPAKGNKLLPLMLGMNGLLLAGVIAVLFLRKPAAAAPDAKPAAHGESKSEGKPEGKAEAHGEAKAEGHGESSHGEGEGKSARSESHEPPSAALPMMKLPEFIVHLHDSDVDHYARITFELQVETDNDKVAIEGRVPQVRDAFLGYLSDRNADDLRGSEGLDKLKSALAEKLPHVVPGVKVAAIYVTDLVVQ